MLRFRLSSDRSWIPKRSKLRWVENLQREDLSALEEADAYRRLMDEFGRTQAASVAPGLGATQALDEGELSPGHARALLAAPDPTALAAEVVRRGLNVRATERLVQRRSEPPRPRPRRRDPDTVALERDLAAHLGLRVTVEPRQRGGSLTLHYTSLDQLDRVLRLLRAS